MKLKIVHQNQETRPGDEHRTTEDELDAKRVEETQAPVVAEDDPIKESSSPLEATPVSASDPLLVSGKRKRKPKELIDEFPPVFRRKKKKSSAPRLKNGMHDSGGSLMSKRETPIAGSSIQFKSPTVIRAEEVQSSLGNDHPTFLKPLVRSHVGSCFWMGLPVPFCRIHLPSKDTTVILENESNEEYPIKYIAHKTGLSAGWRKFVAGNKLLEGDVLIFQLTRPCRLKVHIIRANDLKELDGALSLLNLDSRIKQNEAEGSFDEHSDKGKARKPVLLTDAETENQKEGSLVPQLLHLEEQAGNESDEVASEVLECTKFSRASYTFEDAKSFEEFHIVVSGVCIDSDLPERIRKQYYNLCCSRNAFLHDRLLPGLYKKLASSMIVETVNIADCMRGCKVTTPRKEFEVWEKSLSSFELLGLDVGFLRDRLHQLVKLAFESEGASDAKQYVEAKNERGRVEDEIQRLEAKLGALMELAVRYERDVVSLKTKAESLLVEFQEAVNAPW